MPFAVLTTMSRTDPVTCQLWPFAMLELLGVDMHAAQLSQSTADVDVAGKFGYNDICNPMVRFSD